MVYTIVFVVVGLLAGSIYAIWRAHEEQKAERARFRRIAQACGEAKPWTPPSKGPKGFDRNRRRVA